MRHGRGAFAVDVVIVLAAILIAGKLHAGRGLRPLQVDPTDWSELLRGRELAPAKDSPVLQVVEFLDYQCPGCAAAEAVLTGLEREFPGRIRRVIRHFPITQIHPRADTAALAAECAAEQGRFGPAHRVFFGSPALVADGRWDSLAVLAGVRDLPTFGSCLRSNRVHERIAADIALARKLGVTSTPTLVIDREWAAYGSSPPMLRARLLDRLR